MPDEGLGERLRRLGVGRGAQHLQPQRRRRGPAIEELLPGEVVHSRQGTFFLHRETHDLEYRHGHHSLLELPARGPAPLAMLARDQRLAELDLRRLAFVDTETTGLAGGTGTYAFLVGVGVFGEHGFTIHQFFMRDFDEELAQLQALGELLDGLEGVVSFNGRSFDLPLLETRFVMTRQRPRLSGAPHLDLLSPARRFWQHHLASCALSALELEILGVERTRDDVPGWLIPGLYTDYARSGDAREMPRIFYHNAQDILSLVTLAARMSALLVTPLPADPAVFEKPLSGEELYGLGRVLHDLGRSEQAEAAYAMAARTSRTPRVRELAMRDLAYLLKRLDRRGEALPWWQQLAESQGAVYACQELAKHYEWHDQDLQQALTWTRRGIDLTKSWPRGPKRREALANLEHRLQRLERRLHAAVTEG